MDRAEPSAVFPLVTDEVPLGGPLTASRVVTRTYLEPRAWDLTAASLLPEVGSMERWLDLNA